MGWGGQGFRHVELALKDCGFQMLESINVQYVPDKKQLEEIFGKLSMEIANHLKNSLIVRDFEKKQPFGAFHEVKA